MSFRERYKKRQIFKVASEHHARALGELSSLPVKVAFLVLHTSIWKLDGLFRRMMESPNFEPILVVCPLNALSGSQLLGDLERKTKYFENLGYPTLCTYDFKTGSWLDINSLVKPGIVFFTNPHRITSTQYQAESFMHVLKCYVPYSHQVSKYGSFTNQYDQPFHNMMWKIFASNDFEKQISADYAANKGKNVEVTGYPGIEPFIDPTHVPHDIWKPQPSNKKRVIWAPHHTINPDGELWYSTFLEYADLMVDLAQEHAGEIQWAFKPHPLLKQQLNEHPAWGVGRTNEYYRFWREQPFSQLEEDGYVDLFITSDALIHDCGSFLAEYLYLDKPVLFLKRDEQVVVSFNEFGKLALSVCEHCITEEDISNFVERAVLSGKDANRSLRRKFFKEVLMADVAELPSVKILNSLESALLHS